MDNQYYTVMIAGMAQPGMEEYVRGYLKELMTHSRQDSGCITYNIHRSIANSREFMMYSVWKSQADFERHNETHEMQEFKTKLAKHMFEIQSPKTFWKLLD